MDLPKYIALIYYYILKGTHKILIIVIFCLLQAVT